jgi:hypothetical protein
MAAWFNVAFVASVLLFSFTLIFTHTQTHTQAPGQTPATLLLKFTRASQTRADAPLFYTAR